MVNQFYQKDRLTGNTRVQGRPRYRRRHPLFWKILSIDESGVQVNEIILNNSHSRLRYLVSLFVRFWWINKQDVTP